MDLELTTGVGRPLEALARDRAIARPAELVELAERVYRGIFAAGLHVATVTALYALALIFVQPNGSHRPIAVGICLLLAIGLMAAAQRSSRVYRALRRRPFVWVPVLALTFATAHVVIGPANQVLFPPTLTLLGLLGAVVPVRWVLLAGLLAAAGQVSPVLTHTLSSDDQRALITAAAADVFIPLLFTALIGRLARFMLELHRTITALASASTDPAPIRVKAWSPRPPRPSRPAPRTDDSAPPAAMTIVTPRQLEVIALAAEGLQHTAIGECLDITPGQVTRLLGHARQRVGVATNRELVAWAISNGLLPPAD